MHGQLAVPGDDVFGFASLLWHGGPREWVSLQAVDPFRGVGHGGSVSMVLALHSTRITAPAPILDSGARIVVDTSGRKGRLAYICWVLARLSSEGSGVEFRNARQRASRRYAP